jgi:hypothetical protein
MRQRKVKLKIKKLQQLKWVKNSKTLVLEQERLQKMQNQQEISQT